MATLAEIRAQHPDAYKDLTDTHLADKLHAKFYPDMPREEFDRKVDAPIAIDFNRPAEAVRADVAKLPEMDRQRALKQWANAHVKRERGERYSVPGAISDTVRNLAKGTMVGSFLDEANALTASGLDKLGLPGGAPYDESLEYQRATDRAIESESPITSTLTQLAGGIASATPLITAPKTLLGRAAVGTGAGTAHGALYGAGAGETPEQRMDMAQTGAAVGAPLGFALPFVASTVTRGAGKLGEWGAPMMDRFRAMGQPADEAADAVLGRRLQRAGVTPDEVLRELESGQTAAQVGKFGAAQLPEMITDVSDSTRRLTGSVYRMGGEAGDFIRSTLETRQRGPRNIYAPAKDDMPGQMNTLEDAFGKALGISTGRTAYRTLKQLESDMSKKAHVSYAVAARQSQPFDLQPALDAMALRAQQFPPAFSRKLTEALEMFKATEKGGVKRLPVNTIERFDSSKQALDDLILKAEGNQKRILTEFRSNLIKAVHAPDASGKITKNAAYQKARDQFAGGAAQKEALALGRKALLDDAEVTVDHFRALTSEAERQMFRIGLQDSLRRRMATKKPGDDVTRIFQERRVAEILRDAIPESGRPDRLGDYLARQSRMVKTRNEVLGGSQTAQRTLDDQDLAADTVRQAFNRFRSTPSLTAVAIDWLADQFTRMFAFRQDVAMALARRLLAGSIDEQREILQRLQKQVGPNAFTQFAESVDKAAQTMTSVGARMPGMAEPRPEKRTR